MEYRELGRTGWKVSTISFGCWAIGDAWGAVDDSESLAALNRALDLGVNFFDTARTFMAMAGASGCWHRYAKIDGNRSTSLPRRVGGSIRHSRRL